MVARLTDLVKMHRTKYRVNELVRDGKLYRLEHGMYSDRPDAPEVEILLAKYPSSVLTLDSAYYYYRLSDIVPEHYHLATDRKAAPITDERVAQSFVPSGTLAIGSETRSIGGEELRIFDKERLLIETIRNRTKLPYELYREIIDSYRGIRHELYAAKFDDYLKSFPKRDFILETIRKEVF